ncbi:MAG: response regulator transcription factor [Planctomycetaceae bacterium]|nr:response regulator transcription factor [Planctomycetaceae bacterium]
MFEAPLLYVVDDDAQGLDLVGAMLHDLGLEYERFTSAEELLERYDDSPGCILASDRLPGMGGLELQLELQRRDFVIPVILMTGKPETSVIVRAMQNGAVAVLDKPCGSKALGSAVEAALAIDAERRYHRRRQASMRQRIDSLTCQEQEVMRQIVDGAPNKVTASRLGVSVRTIENRRRSIFAKLGIRSVAELVATVMQATPEVSRPTSRRPAAVADARTGRSLLCSAS